MTDWTPPPDLPWPALQVRDGEVFTVNHASTIRTLYVEALLRDPQVRSGEVRALLIQALSCRWADVWERAFSELWHPSDAGAQPFLLGFVRLCQQFEPDLEG
ncbi:hypothetical protein [Deinococcus cellulosilyticus]|uniref:Uncharacterized protein n=1 Tax=Deinococcus cellulosilyticus (strain DSM 18568 / NBRC 106333 / KACC 11606 / 5516J-15) TaxID=1223518 RepID=A0A511N1E5_DEIC1|nr:hypothetical protein [Deinococcus cellulosilyticus]GEM46693.1 hypothetical protein DC3_23280 [Deinococcus cellulosilyticus NBRC 106333 = KACC 11606]